MEEGKVEGVETGPGGAGEGGAGSVRVGTAEEAVGRSRKG